MLWTDESGKRINSVVSQQITLPDNTFERFETITVSAKHRTQQTLTCSATGVSLNGTSTTEITLLPIPGKSGSWGLVIGLIIGVLVVIAILVLFVGRFLQRYHPDYLPRKGCNWNPCWRRPQEPQRFHEEEEYMLRPSHGSSSLTKEQLQECKEELKAYYRVSRRTVTLNPLNFMECVDLDDIYTNLTIVDRSNMCKTPITYDDLLIDIEHGNLSKRVLIEGEGGVGKSTLCAKIAWDWCQGRILQEVDMVLLILLRDVTDGNSIGSTMKGYLFDSNRATTEAIDNFILTNPSKVLFLFDGFDEFKGKLGEGNSNEVIRILELQRHKSCKVIVTTRPWRTNEIRMDKYLGEAYTFIKVEGFNEENLSAYIRRYFRMREQDTLAEDLISFIGENDVIKFSMAPFPIYCAMLCLMWNEYSEERRKEMKELQTFSKVFREMVFFLKEHYASKFCQNLQNQKAVKYLMKANGAIHHISEIALNGLLERILSFPEEQFRECRDAMETCCRVGVLTIERDVITGERRHDVNITSFVKSTVSFPHKLFQEYIAGLYIENVFNDDRTVYYKLKKKLIPRFEEFRSLLYFSSSFGNELGVDIINDLTSTNDQYFCVDVAFECQTEMAARVVGERWKEYIILPKTPQHTTSGIFFLMHWNQVVSDTA
ncbi:NACHT, LRR and PYD domains-containing protein 3-like [Diadema setosum]|uniref:NACHT, LRR and PYD domains-containing protein 3-like n=1 Tax=Diadema setosum TaxID=31175 RepID=UPI003B3AFC3E